MVTFFALILSPVTILLAQKHGIHVTQFIGGALLAVGAVATSLVNNISYMYLTYGVLIGISGALVYSPAISIIPDFFAKHVSIATGIGSAGNMIGLTVFSFILPTLLDELGWRKALWCVAATGPLISLLGTTLPRTAAEPCVDDKEWSNEISREPWWKVLKKKAYILLCISFFFLALVEFVPVFIVVSRYITGY